MIEAIFWGAVLRFLRAAIQSAPTVLVGLVVAGIMHRLLGQANTRRLFGCGTWRELPQAWLIGMLLPVCSLGVIPISREMRRSGISPGTVLAFALTAPLFNPLSLLYGLTMSEPLAIITFAFCSMIVVTGVGALLNRLFPASAREEPAPLPVAHGLKRMASIVVLMAREITGPSVAFIFIGLSSVALLCMVLQPGSLQSTMEHSNRFAPLAMVGVAIPAYTTPMMAMSQLGSMFQHANSPGAAFVLLTFGAGLNVGLIAWTMANYGWKRSLAWLALLIATVLALAYAIEDPLYPREITPPGHTHAFDVYCNPYSAGTSQLPYLVASKIREDLQPAESVGLIVLAALSSAGFIFRALDRRWRIEDWLESEANDTPETPSMLNVSVSPPVLGGVALCVLIALSVVGCYAYYPSPTEVFEEMTILKGEVLTAALSGDAKHATHFIPIWDDWTRRLQIGILLREGNLSAYRRMKAKIFRDRLEFLKHAIEEGDKEETREYIRFVSNSYLRLRKEFLKDR